MLCLERYTYKNSLFMVGIIRETVEGGSFLSETVNFGRDWKSLKFQHKEYLSK